MTRRRLRLRWLWASYLMVGGGFVLSAVALHLLHYETRWVSATTCFLASAIGGGVACRASPGRTIVEATAGAVLFGGTVLLVLSSKAWFLGGRSPEFALTAAAMSVVGGFIGALAGERSEPSNRYSTLRWIGVGGLIHAGAMVFAAATTAWVHPLAAAVMATILGGWTIQIVAPRRVYLACWLSSTSIVFMTMPLLLQEAPNAGAAIGVVGGILVTTALWGLLGLIGGGLAWAMLDNWIERVTVPPPEQLPSAKLR